MDLSTQYEQIAKDHAEDFAKSKLAKDKIKSQLAILTLKYLDTGVAVNRAEVMARGSEEFQKYLREAENVIARAEIGRSKMKSIEMQMDYQRSVNALERAKMNLL